MEFVAANFTFALFFTIRRLSDLLLHSSRFTLSRLHASRKKNLPYSSLRKRDFKLRKYLIYEFPAALLLYCSSALLLYRYAVCAGIAICFFDL
jgi:hypothetical protein